MKKSSKKFSKRYEKEELRYFTGEKFRNIVELQEEIISKVQKEDSQSVRDNFDIIGKTWGELIELAYKRGFKLGMKINCK